MERNEIVLHCDTPIGTLTGLNLLGKSDDYAATTDVSLASGALAVCGEKTAPAVAGTHSARFKQTNSATANPTRLNGGKSRSGNVAGRIPQLLSSATVHERHIVAIDFTQ